MGLGLGVGTDLLLDGVVLDEDVVVVLDDDLWILSTHLGSGVSSTSKTIEALWLLAAESLSLWG